MPQQVGCVVAESWPAGWTDFASSGSQHVQQGLKGAAAMAERKLVFERDLSHGAVERGQIKQRVVSKTAGASRSVEDHALNRTLGGVKWPTVASRYQDAAIAGRALSRGHTRQML